jgi:hypothetical protein
MYLTTTRLVVQLYLRLEQTGYTTLHQVGSHLAYTVYLVVQLVADSPYLGGMNTFTDRATVR